MKQLKSDFEIFEQKMGIRLSVRNDVLFLLWIIIKMSQDNRFMIVTLVILLITVHLGHAVMVLHAPDLDETLSIHAYNALLWEPDIANFQGTTSHHY